MINSVKKVVFRQLVTKQDFDSIHLNLRINLLYSQRYMDSRLKLTPIRLALLSYLVAIVLGTILLWLPFSTIDTKPISLIDAFFTATSAVCVTGLIVQDTATYFTTFGQSVLLVLIQLGGLGIMTLYASIPIFFGKQMKLSERTFFHQIVEADSYFGIKKILTNIVKYTLFLEMLGSVILTARFYAIFGDFKKALFYGVFHAVSAFCNAGFALFSDSFMSFHGDVIINITILVLVLLGGLGFLVLQQLLQTRSIKRLSANAKLVLLITAILFFMPSFFLFHFEFSNAFSGLSIGDKIMAAFFQIGMTRTAGFNSIDFATMQNTSILMICILMFIGAAPGGTGGGVKITTVALLFLSMRSIFKRQADIDCFKKRVPSEIVTKSIAILAISFSLVSFFMMVIMSTENAPFLEVFFEVISAFGTVGLSIGLTSKLSFSGKLLISILMFIGRIGSLSLVFILTTEKKSLGYKYPNGKFMVG